VQFFTVGNLGGRTLVIYMTKKNVGGTLSRSIRLLAKNASQLNSVFRVLEPIFGRINESTKALPWEWFRLYRVGFALHYPSVR